MAKNNDLNFPSTAAQLARQTLLGRLGTQWVVGQWLPPVAELARIIDSGHVSTHRAVVQLAKEGYLLPLRGKGTRVLKTDEHDAPGRTGKVASQDKGAVSMGASEVPSPGSTLLPGLAVLARSPRIAIIRTRDTDPIIHHMIDACMEAAKPMGAQFFFVFHEGNELSVTLTEQYDAVVIFNNWLQDDLKGIVPFSNKIVRVFTGQFNVEHAALCDMVTVDQAQVGALAAKCLRDAGCETVCFFGKRQGEFGEYDATSLARLRGFEAVWGSCLEPEYLMYGQFYGPKTGMHGHLRWAKLSPRPQGIFAASDELAAGVLNAAILEGLVPGVDFQLVGVDGQERYRNSTGFPLTSVQMPSSTMGRQAARMIRQRLMEGETHAMRVVLSCSLFEGQTVRKIEQLSEQVLDPSSSSLS